MKKKLAVFTRNGIVGNIAINKAIPHILNLGYEPVIFNTGEPYSKKADISELKEVSFYETGLLRDVLSPFVKDYGSLTHHGKPIPNLCYTNEELAKLYNLDYEVVPNINHESFVERIESDQNFIGACSIRILQIFHERLITAFENKKNGFVWNMHTGLLPKYKGVHIPYHAIEHGEKTYGWTLHKVFRGIDTGDILDIGWLPLNNQKSVLSLYLNMIPKGTEMIKNSLLNYKKFGKVPEIPQPSSMMSSYFTHPTSIQMQNHAKNGVFFTTKEEIIGAYLGAYSLAGTEHYKHTEECLRSVLSSNESRQQSNI